MLPFFLGMFHSYLLMEDIRCVKKPLVLFLIFLSGCQLREVNQKFELLNSDNTGVKFENRLEPTFRFNAYTFRNFYNGGAVALGDINNDGLVDLYFTGNQVGNSLYLNKGDFKFEDISKRAGVNCVGVWNTGATLADVNGDGYLDIFVCKSGPPSEGVRYNQLFINNRDLTFTDASFEWGVADIGLSIQAAFFDYDRDGDLDFYLSSNSNRPVGFFDLFEGKREVRDAAGGNKLYRNEGTRFVDVSEEANIYGSSIGYGLGVSIADINKDGWPDIYVSNDFFEKDYLYLNQRNGTFKEVSDVSLKSMSLGSMGADIADLNNDGYPEIFVTEMLPKEQQDLKSKIAFETYNKQSENNAKGYHYQYNRNVLQWNMGLIPNDTNTVFFSEVGRLAGVEASDWSWSGLFLDIDNDGYRDIFVSNGIPKDLLDQDYITYFAPSVLNSKDAFKDSTLLLKLINGMPAHVTHSALFRSKGEMNFEYVSQEKGILVPSFSNGAAYGDLNNDGALELIVNPINQKAMIYRNIIPKNNASAYVQFSLTDTSRKNTFALGAQVDVFCGGERFYAELYPVRGYLSSVDYKIHIGLGTHKKIDSVKITWPSGEWSSHKNILINSQVRVDKVNGLLN